MKWLAALIISIGFLFLYSKCKSSEVFTPETFDKRKINFGSGGGFAGTITEYSLLENGQLFGRQSQSSPWQAMDTLQKTQVKQYFKQIEQLNLLKVKFDRPGNWSYFITIEENGKPHKIQWCAEVKPQQASVISFYNILNENVKSLPPFKRNDPVR